MNRRPHSESIVAVFLIDLKSPRTTEPEAELRLISGSIKELSLILSLIVEIKLG